VRSHGATGDGTTDDTGAIQAAIDEAAADDGGTVVVPAGEYEIRPIELFDGVTLHLESGAALRASTDPDDYERGEYPLAGLIRAKDAEDIAITGRGVIDGRGMEFLDTDARRSLGPDSLLEPTRQGLDFSHPRHGTEDGPADDPDERPDRMFVIYNCRDVRVEGVKIVDSPFWTLHLISCDDVHVSNVTIDNDRLIPNSDGIIPDMSRNVTITGCNVRAGDDAIVLKATGFGDHGRPTENIVVGDCTLVSRSSAIKFGSSTHYDIRDCVFNNLVIYDSNRALGIQHRDAGIVQDVLFSNVVIHTRLHTGNWWGKAEPIWVTSLPRRDGDEVGGVRDVTFRNIESDVEGGAIIYSAEESFVEDVTLDGVDVRLTDAEYADAVGGNFDFRIDRREENGQRLFEHDIPGVYVGNATDVVLSDVSVAWGEDDAAEDATEGDDALPGYYSSAIEAESVSGLTIDGLDGRGAHDSPVISLSECRAVTIRDSRATEGADAFLESEDGADYRGFVGNDLAEAETTDDAFEAFAARSGNVL
jgi:polygalacturonase